MPRAREPRPTELGETLTRLREALGIGQADAAERAGGRHADLDQNAVTRFERGRLIPTRAQLLALLDLYRPDPDVGGWLLERTRESQPEHRRTSTAHPSAAKFQHEWADLERRAIRHRSVTATIVPGLLQTDDYALALAGGITDHGQRQRWLEVRRARRDAAVAGQRQFIVTLGALLYPQAPRAVLAEQVSQLADIVDAGQPPLGVLVPAARSAPELPGNVDLFELPSGARTVVTMTIDGVLLIRDPSAVDRISDLLDQLADLAVWGAAAREALEQVGRTLR